MKRVMRLIKWVCAIPYMFVMFFFVFIPVMICCLIAGVFNKTGEFADWFGETFYNTLHRVEVWIDSE